MRSSRKEKMSPNEKALREGIMIYDDFMLFEEFNVSKLTEVTIRPKPVAT